MVEPKPLAQKWTRHFSVGPHTVGPPLRGGRSRLDDPCAHDLGRLADVGAQRTGSHRMHLHPQVDAVNGVAADRSPARSEWR